MLKLSILSEVADRYWRMCYRYMPHFRIQSAKAAFNKYVPHRIINIFLTLLSGTLFSAILYYAYGKINIDLYYLRDDGITTLSHARNLIDYGFVGVNPSGERIEGFSAPVEFFSYALIYLVSGARFDTYDKLQTLVCTFSLGVFIFLFFRSRLYFALFSVIGSAIYLSQSSSFMEWHGSGMENAITHVLFLATAYTLFTFSRDHKVIFALVIVPFLASISRLEGIFHVFPMLIIFSIYWTVFERNKNGVLFILLFIALWIAYDLSSYAYFGDSVPNTAYAQRIVVTERILAPFYHHDWVITQSLETANHLFSAHGGYLYMLALPMFPISVRSRHLYLLMLMTLSIIVTSWLSPFFFGPTRIDPTRATTQMALFVCLGLLCSFYGVTRCKAFILIPILIPVGYAIYSITYVQPYYICCRIARFESIRQQLYSIGNNENLPRPNVSNSDLGLISWHKQFNIVDLGALGSQIIAKLKSGPVLTTYFFDYAAPDMIETIAPWSCLYFDSIFSDPRFLAAYTPAGGQNILWKPCRGSVSPAGIWIRKDIQRGSGSAERKLIDDLAANLDVDRVRGELRNCQSTRTNIEECVYVARTVFRFLPEFRASGHLDELRNIFELSRTKDFDMFLITGFQDGRANEKAIAFLQSETLNKSGFTKIAGADGFEINVNSRYVVFINRRCSAPRIMPTFVLHVVPVDVKAAKLADSKFPPDAGVKNMDFDFSEFTFTGSNTCSASIELPKWKIRSLTMGQWVPERNSGNWDVTFDFPNRDR